MSDSLPCSGTTRTELLLSLRNLQSTGRQNSTNRWSYYNGVSMKTVTLKRAQFNWKRKAVGSLRLQSYSDSVSLSAFDINIILKSEFAAHTSQSTLKQLKIRIKTAWAGCITYDGDQRWLTGMLGGGTSVVSSVVSSHWWHKSKQNPYHSSVCGIGAHLKVAALGFNKTKLI